MFFVALAGDYATNPAHEGRVDAATVAALEKVKKSGRKLILVTGRDLNDLRRVFPATTLIVGAALGAYFQPAMQLISELYR